jgi:purine nucleoside permease
MKICVHETAFWLLSFAPLISCSPFHLTNAVEKRWYESPVTPKVMIISMFGPEGSVWYTSDGAFNVLAHNITVPGLSPIYPDVHCTDNYDVCQITIGEGEIALSFEAEPTFKSSKCLKY